MSSSKIPVDLRLMYYLCLNIIGQVPRIKDPEGFKRFLAWQKLCRVSGQAGINENIKQAILHNILVSEGRCLR